MSDKQASRNPRLVTLDAANFDAWPCCGIKNTGHCGRQEKRRWLLQHAASGLTGKLLVTADDEAAGYIEYVPGEQAWRAVEAAGYMVIHCLWIFAKRHQSQGYGRVMVEDCVRAAKAAGKSGVAAVVRDGPWSADHRLFAALGFKSADTAPPDFRLMVKTFDAKAKRPAFKTGWDKKLARYKKGLTIIRSGQCPHSAKFTADIAASAQAEFGLKPRVVELKSAHEAQEAPTPYAVFAVILDGRIVADHQISRARFRNIMKKETARPRADPA